MNRRALFSTFISVALGCLPCIDVLAEEIGQPTHLSHQQNPPAVEANVTQEVGDDIRGQIVARHHAILSSQIGAVIKKIRIREGDVFKVGAPLIELDCRSFEALLAQSKASERLAQVVLTNTESLAKMQSASVQEVDKAKCELDICTQGRILSELDVQRCVVTAPFTGAVVSVLVGLGEHVSTGKPLVEIVGLGDLEVHFLIPSTMSTSVRVGQKISAHIHETKSTIQGTIRQLAPMTDPLNRSIKVFATLLSPGPNIKPGMSGIIELKDSTNP